MVIFVFQKQLAAVCFLHRRIEWIPSLKVICIGCLHNLFCKHTHINSLQIINIRPEILY